jgi:two-component system response regulator AtoC
MQQYIVTASPPLHAHALASLADEMSVGPEGLGRRRQGTVGSIQSAAQYQAQPSVPVLTLVEGDTRSQVEMVGVSAAWRKLVLQAEMAAPHLQVALIEGEHGIGKHMLARYLHSRSLLVRSGFQRRDAREWLATDGDPDALTGFLYLDRVDLLTIPGQNLLLGVLKALQDRPAGRGVLLASSHTPLRQMAAQGSMLPDLAFRLTAIRFAVPPLRQRREDIAPLAQALLARICARYQHRPVVLGPGALSRLLRHDWPGNIRELAGVLEAALFDAENGVVLADHLALSPEPGAQAPPQATGHPNDISLDAIIHKHVKYVLDLNRGNKLRAARQLAISRSTLYRILGNESLLPH